MLKKEEKKKIKAYKPPKRDNRHGLKVTYTRSSVALAEIARADFSLQQLRERQFLPPQVATLYACRAAMDPSAMDFVMHRSPSEPSRLLPDAMPQHHSPCPAMRAAAAAAAAAPEQNHHQGLGANTRMGGRPHYDPVHGSTSSGSWWQPPQPPQHPQYSHQQQAMPHLGWPPALYPPYARTTAPIYTPNFPPVPSPGASNPGPGTSSHIPPRMHTHENYSGHSHPLSQMHSPPTFHHPPTIPSLNRIGGSAPAHHSQGFSTHVNNSDSHVPRTTGLPALHPFSSMGSSQTSHR